MLLVDIVVEVTGIITSSLAAKKVREYERLPLVAQLIAFTIFVSNCMTSACFCLAVEDFDNSNHTSSDFKQLLSDDAFGKHIVFHEMFVCLHISMSLVFIWERYINTNNPYSETFTNIIAAILFVLALLASIYGAEYLLHDEMKSLARYITVLYMFCSLAAIPFFCTMFCKCVKVYQEGIGDPLEKRYQNVHLKRFNKCFLRVLLGQAVCYMVGFALIRPSSVNPITGHLTFGREFKAYHNTITIGNIIFTCCFLVFPRFNVFRTFDRKREHPMDPLDRRDQHFNVLNKFWTVC